MENRYILSTNTYDSKVFAICLFDREINSFIVSESIVGEKEFKKREEELLQQYNAIKVNDAEIVKEKPSKTNIEILQKYKHIYDYCINKINGMLQEEMYKEK